MLRHQQFIRSLALAGLATAALIAPHAAMARPAADPDGKVQASHVLVDLRSPDAATPVTIQATRVDLRSPDAVTPVKIQPTQVDLRSPDTVTPVHAPTAPKIPQPQTIGNPSASSNDFDFGSAAVGAGAAVLLALACFGSMVAVQRRRSPLSLGH
jgi:hypothetical protein